MYKNIFELEDYVETPLGNGTIIGAGDSHGHCVVKLDIPLKDGDSRGQQDIILDTFQIKHIVKEIKENKMKFEMETMREIFNGEDKSIIEIGPDRDGLGCVEIRYREDNGKITERITFAPEQARLVAIALEQCANELTNYKLSKGE